MSPTEASRTENKQKQRLDWLMEPYEPLPHGKQGRTIGMYLFYYFIPAVIVGILATLAAQKENINVANLSIITGILTYGAILLVYKPIFKESLKQVIKPIKKEHWIFALKCFLVLTFGNMLLTFIPSPVPENQQLLESALDAGNPIYFAIYTVLLAPIVEELLFRHLFFRGMTGGGKKRSPWPFICNVLFFTFLHTGTGFLDNPGGALQYMWLSIVFGYAYAKTRDIEASLALHLINNGIAFVAILMTTGI